MGCCLGGYGTYDNRRLSLYYQDEIQIPCVYRGTSAELRIGGGMHQYVVIKLFGVGGDDKIYLKAIKIAPEGITGVFLHDFERDPSFAIPWTDENKVLLSHIVQH